MSLSTKILIWLGAVLLIGSIGFVIYKQIEISNRQEAIEKNIVAQKELVDGVFRSQSSWATKDDVEKIIKNNGLNLNAIKEDLDKLHADISAVNAIIVTSSGQHGTNIPSTGTGPSNPNPTPVDPNNPDPYGYLSKQQLFSVNENFSGTIVPVGQVGFSAWQQAPWSVDILPREYKVVNVLGLDDNEKTYVYNKFSIKTGEKNYDVKISSAQTEQIFPEASMSWWNPRIFLTAGGAVNLSQVPVQGSANMGATLGIMSYGKFKSTPDISILQVGAVYETGTGKAGVIVNPVSFNIGGILPSGLVRNTYLGPSLQMDTSGNIFTGLNLGVGL